MLFTPRDRESGRPAQEIGAAGRDGKVADVRWHVAKDGTPVFIDVGIDDYQAQIDQIEASTGPLRGAILIPDLMGGICDWDRVREIADRQNPWRVFFRVFQLNLTENGRRSTEN